MPVKHGPKNMLGKVAEAHGTPYTLGEARAWLEMYGDRLDIYPRELMEWLCDRVEALQQFAATHKTTETVPGSRPPGVPNGRGGEKRRK